MSIALVVGCGGHSKGSKATPSPTEPGKEREVLTKSASLTQREQSAKRERIYEVHCQTSDLHFNDKSKNYEGTMEVVTGTLFEKDKPVATFSADSGEANKQGKLVLNLRGHVKIIGLRDNDVMTCKDMTWLHDDHLIKADGAVTVVDKKGTLGPMDEVWNDPDRHIYATPDLFPK